MNKLERANAALTTAEARMHDALEALEAADDSIADEELEALNREFDEADAERSTAKQTVAREERIAAARAATPAPTADSIKVGEEEPVYSRGSDRSYFQDIFAAKNSTEARERLQRNNEMVMEARKARGETRANASGTGFLPPLYLADQWAGVPRAGRPFANALPKLDLPPYGTAISYPVVSGGTAVGLHADNGNVTDTAMTTTTRTSNLYTIAGQNEVDRVVMERSYPGIDQVIFDDLRRAYDALVDSKCVNGSGSGEPLGILNVGSINTVTGSVSNQKATLLNIYQAVSKIAATRYMNPTAILMHPRRAAWLASGFDSTFPIFNQGGMNAFQVGSQDEGFVGEIAGLNVIADPNVPTNLGAGTNEDPIFVMVLDDLRLAEEGVQSATFEESNSGTLAIRLQLWGFVATIMDRYPTGICEITGLTAPTGF